MACDLPPGARISEAEIAAHYGISRQPVREAFIKLSEEGLIKVRPQRGTVVARIDIQSVLDARFVREATEADIVRLLAVDPDAALLAELGTQLAAQETVPKNSPADFIVLDDLFHRTLAEGAGRRTVWSLIETLKVHFDRVRFITSSRFPTDTILAQHRHLVERIAAGDPAGAERAIRSHLRAVLDDLPKVTTTHPEFFEGEIPDDLPRPTAA
ncbi:MAG: GntR family transcriptional regulator [Acuticoccus sp.]